MVSVCHVLSTQDCPRPLELCRGLAVATPVPIERPQRFDGHPRDKMLRPQARFIDLKHVPQEALCLTVVAAHERDLREQSQCLRDLRVRLTEAANLSLQRPAHEPVGHVIGTPLGAHASEKTEGLGDQKVGRLKLCLASLEGSPSECLSARVLANDQCELGKVQQRLGCLQVITPVQPLSQS
jgi:hypothetical protein